MSTRTTTKDKKEIKRKNTILSPIDTQIRHLLAYRSISGVTDEGTLDERLLRHCNPTNIPKSVIINNKEGKGHDRCIVIRHDRGKIFMDISVTELEPAVCPLVYAGTLALRIRMKKPTKPDSSLPIKDFDTFSVDKLCFPIYTNILGVIGELVLYHELQLEWSCCWALLNLHKLPIVDSGYISMVKKIYPIIIDDILAACISLESVGLAFYKKKGYPIYFQFQTNITIEYNNLEEINKQTTNNDFIPLPELYLRRTSSNDEKGYSKYELYESIEDIKGILRLIHQDTTVKDLKKKIITIQEMIDFCFNNLLKYKVYPTPYIVRKEIPEVNNYMFRKSR